MADSAVQVARWAIDAGWTGTDAATATAVALRVSGGDTTKRGGLYGLGTAGGGAEQTAAAHTAWTGRGKDWSVFSGYRDRGYLLYMPAAAAAAAVAAGAGAAEDTAQAVKEAITDQAAAVKEAGQTTARTAASVGQFLAFINSPTSWDRIVKVGLGATVIAIGFVYLWKQSIGDRFLAGVRAVGNDVARGPDSVTHFATRTAGNIRAGLKRNAARKKAAATPPPSGPP